MTKIPQITLIGYAGQEEYPPNSNLPEYCFSCAEKLGEAIGSKKWYLITGGESGVMDSACRGAKKTGGTTIGVMTGQKRQQSNKNTDIEVITNNYVTGSTPTLIAMADIVIVCGGGSGTLQEIAIAYRLNKPIILMRDTGGWADKLKDDFLDERKKYPLLRAKNVQECMNVCQKIIRKQVNGRG